MVDAGSGTITGTEENFLFDITSPKAGNKDPTSELYEFTYTSPFPVPSEFKTFTNTVEFSWAGAWYPMRLVSISPRYISFEPAWDKLKALGIDLASVFAVRPAPSSTRGQLTAGTGAAPALPSAQIVSILPDPREVMAGDETTITVAVRNDSAAAQTYKVGVSIGYSENKTSPMPGEWHDVALYTDGLGDYAEITLDAGAAGTTSRKMKIPADERIEDVWVTVRSADLTVLDEKLFVNEFVAMQTAMQKAWTEFAKNPNVISAIGLLPSSTIESFSRVFTGYSYIEGRPAEPRDGDWAAVGLILSGVALGVVGTVMALIPAGGAAPTLIAPTAEKIAEEFVKHGYAWSSAWTLGAIGKKFLMVLGALGALYGYVFTTEWTAKEGLVEIMSFPVWAALDTDPKSLSKDDLLKIRDEYLPKLQEGINHARELISSVAHLWPPTTTAWLEYADGAQEQHDIYVDTVNRMLEERPVDTGEIAVTTNPEKGATVYLDGIPQIQKSDMTIRDVPVGAHRIEVIKEPFGGIEYIVTPEFLDVNVTTDVITPAEFEVKASEVPPTTGALFVKSSPTGATVFLDGVPQEFPTNTVVADLDAGEYSVEVFKDGYIKPAAQSIVISVGETQTVDFGVLTPEEAPPTPVPTPPEALGRLEVTTSPGEVEISIAEGMIGVTNTEGSLSVELEPGTYTLQLSKEGYKTQRPFASIKSGQTTKISAIMIPVEVTEKAWKVSLSATDPEGNTLRARVYINEFLYDWPTPTNVLLDPGTYTFRFDLAGYEPATVTETLEEFP